MAHRMDLLRQHLRLVHGGQVRVLFEHPYLSPKFECAACEQKMHWEVNKGWWNCPDCGYELTPNEAGEIVLMLASGIRLLKSDVKQKRGSKGFFTWLSEKLFGRRNYLPP